jgi:hypothetical protein
VCTWTDQNGSPIALGARDGDFFTVRRGFAAELPAAIPSTSKDEP